MRIIAGRYKGQTISAGKDQSIRPTTNRIKTYIFDLLGNFVDGAIVLDLFSGAGSLGLEALSRGASEANFVDISGRSLRVLRQNIEKIGVAEPFKLIKADAVKFLQRNEKTFDIIFADPVYRWTRFDLLLPAVFSESHLATDGVLVLESEIGHSINWESKHYTILRQKQFSHCYITLFIRKESS